MPETRPTVPDIQAQYAAQVAADLERNIKEQERIATEAAALEEQLSILRRDHAVLASVQQALGSKAPAGPTPKDAVTGNGGRAKAPAARATRTKPAVPRQKKPAADKPKSSEPKAQSSDQKEPEQPAKTTLVTLVREHLDKQTEPRSSAEITTGLLQAHPDRTIKATVVRTTVEGLVAKGHAHRSKQGSSVFYSAAPATPAQSADA